jgi:hypothetical protein
MKRFKTESQGDLRLFWNVIDTKTNIYVKRLMPYKKAIKLVKELNKPSIRQLRNDLADLLYRFFHS